MQSLAYSTLIALTLTSAAATATAAKFQADPARERRLQEGKEQLERIKGDPMARSCWDSAVAALESGCRSMDDARRSRLAVMVRARPGPAARAARAIFFSPRRRRRSRPLLFFSSIDRPPRAPRSLPTATWKSPGWRRTRAPRR